MGSINGDQIIQEFFDLWMAKVEAGLTPAAGLAEIEQEQPGLFAFYRITDPRRQGRIANVKA